jgi:hypothetical protein
LVQDAHGVASAQRRIAELLAAWSSDGAVGWVGLEGAAGPFALDAFRAYPDRAVTRALADHFLERGWLSGPEWFGLTADRLPQFWGVEDPALYAAHVKATRESFAAESRVKDRLAAARAAVEALKSALYSSALRAFDVRRAERRAGRVSLGDYVRFLARQPGAPAGPALATLRDLVDRESHLDFVRVDAERRRLLESLAARLPTERLNELADAARLCRAGRETPAVFHRRLADAARDAGIPTAAWPAFAAYVDYVHRAEALPAGALLADLDAREAAVEEKLVRSPRERELARLDQTLSRVERLVRRGASPEDWSALAARWDGAVHWIDDFNRLARAAGAKPLPADGRWAEDLAPSADFCRRALERNAALVRGLDARTGGEGASVLVAGGFHTDGLAALLAARGDSFAVVTPRFDVDADAPGAADPLAAFARPPTPLEKVLEGDAIFLATPKPTALRPLEGTHDPDTVVRLTAILQARLDTTLSPGDASRLSGGLPRGFKKLRFKRDPDGGFDGNTVDVSFDGVDWESLRVHPVEEDVTDSKPRAGPGTSMVRGEKPWNYRIEPIPFSASGRIRNVFSSATRFWDRYRGGLGSLFLLTAGIIVLKSWGPWDGVATLNSIGDGLFGGLVMAVGAGTRPFGDVRWRGEVREIQKVEAIFQSRWPMATLDKDDFLERSRELVRLADIHRLFALRSPPSAWWPELVRRTLLPGLSTEESGEAVLQLFNILKDIDKRSGAVRDFGLVDITRVSLHPVGKIGSVTWTSKSEIQRAIGELEVHKEDTRITQEISDCLRFLPFLNFDALRVQINGESLRNLHQHTPFEDLSRLGGEYPRFTATLTPDALLLETENLTRKQERMPPSRLAEFDPLSSIPPLEFQGEGGEKGVGTGHVIAAMRNIYSFQQRAVYDETMEKLSLSRSPRDVIDRFPDVMPVRPTVAWTQEKLEGEMAGHSRVHLRVTLPFPPEAHQRVFLTEYTLSDLQSELIALLDSVSTTPQGDVVPEIVSFYHGKTVSEASVYADPKLHRLYVDVNGLINQPGATAQLTRALERQIPALRAPGEARNRWRALAWRYLGVRIVDGDRSAAVFAKNSPAFRVARAHRVLTDFLSRMDADLSPQTRLEFNHADGSFLRAASGALDVAGARAKALSELSRKSVEALFSPTAHSFRNFVPLATGRRYYFLDWQGPATLIIRQAKTPADTSSVLRALTASLDEGERLRMSFEINDLSRFGEVRSVVREGADGRETPVSDFPSLTQWDILGYLYPSSSAVPEPSESPLATKMEMIPFLGSNVTVQKSRYEQKELTISGRKVPLQRPSPPLSSPADILRPLPWARSLRAHLPRFYGLATGAWEEALFRWVPFVVGGVSLAGLAALDPTAWATLGATLLLFPAAHAFVRALSYARGWVPSIFGERFRRELRDEFRRPGGGRVSSLWAGSLFAVVYLTVGGLGPGGPLVSYLASVAAHVAWNRRADQADAARQAQGEHRLEALLPDLWRLSEVRLRPARVQVRLDPSRWEGRLSASLTFTDGGVVPPSIVSESRDGIDAWSQATQRNEPQRNGVRALLNRHRSDRDRLRWEESAPALRRAGFNAGLLQQLLAIGGDTAAPWIQRTTVESLTGVLSALRRLDPPVEFLRGFATAAWLCGQPGRVTTLDDWWSFRGRAPVGKTLVPWVHIPAPEDPAFNEGVEAARRAAQGMIQAFRESGTPHTGPRPRLIIVTDVAPDAIVSRLEGVRRSDVTIVPASRARAAPGEATYSLSRAFEALPVERRIELSKGVREGYLQFPFFSPLPAEWTPGDPSSLGLTAAQWSSALRLVLVMGPLVVDLLWTELDRARREAQLFASQA